MSRSLFIYLSYIKKDKVNYSTSILWKGIMQGSRCRNLSNSKCLWFQQRYWKVFMSIPPETVEISSCDMEKMLLIKECVAPEPRKELLTLWIHCRLALGKYFISLLAAAVYTWHLLRLCLLDNLQISYKLVLLKQE